MTSDPPQLIDNFQHIELKKPVDIIIGQIQHLITSGVLKPGDRLPSERALSEKLGVGRGYVREAIKKLEFYGILKTLPQSATYVASLGVKALEGLIANVLALDQSDINSLLETREILEINAARLAASRADKRDLQELVEAHEIYQRQIQERGVGMADDLFFHLKVAECSKNTVLMSLISILTPDVIAISNKMNVERDGRPQAALVEHQAILEAIKLRDPQKAVAAMEVHMRRAREQFNAGSRTSRD